HPVAKRSLKHSFLWSAANRPSQTVVLHSAASHRIMSDNSIRHNATRAAEVAAPRSADALCRERYRIAISFPAGLGFDRPLPTGTSLATLLFRSSRSGKAQTSIKPNNHRHATEPPH